MNPNLKRALMWLGVAALVVALVVAGGALYWANTPLQPTKAALDALKPDYAAKVTHSDGMWTFSPPANTETTHGVIFYPGGHVDPRAYARYARDIAEEGYVVVVPEMPWSLAVFYPNAADKARAANPTIERWVIGGHSLGGAMAGKYVATHPDQMAGLLLLAAYMPSGNDISGSKISVLTEVGTLDTVVNRKNLEAGKALLPSMSPLLELPGGNHAQFGDYGTQPGDNSSPNMSADDQRLAAVQGTISLLRGKRFAP